MRFVLASVAMLSLLSGCASQEVMQFEAQSAEPAPTTTTTPSPTQTTEAEPEQTAGPTECSGEVQASIESVINAQVAAFGEEDFELAYSFASPGFQASVGLNQFVQIISGSYGPLIESSSLVFSDCLTDSEAQVGLLIAKFIQQSNEVYALRYLMVNTDDGWRVQGASNLEVVGEGA